MTVWKTFWFWILMVALLGLILSFIFFETYGTSSNGTWNYPAWIWIIFGVSILLFAIAFVLYLRAIYQVTDTQEECVPDIPKCEDVCKTVPVPTCPPVVNECPDACPKEESKCEEACPITK